MSDNQSHTGDQYRIQNLSQEVKNLDKQVKTLQTEKKNLIAAIVIGVFIALISPGYTVLSNSNYKMKIESTRRDAVDKVWTDFWASKETTEFTMTCIAFDRYFNNTGSPALVRWIEADSDFSYLENRCNRMSDPEPVFPEP
jgi:hypothetical protein